MRSSRHRGADQCQIALSRYPMEKIVFVEVKNTGKKPTPLQLRDHARRRELGCDVRVIDNMDDANAFKS